MAMLHYRNTPPKGHTYSPAQRMLFRRTKTTLPTAVGALAPQLVSHATVIQEIQAKRAASKRLYDKEAGLDHSELEVGSYAYAKPPPNRRGQPWSYGVVTNVDRRRSYTLQTPSGSIRRNRVHIRPAAPPLSVTTKPLPVPTLPYIPPTPYIPPDDVATHTMMPAAASPEIPASMDIPVQAAVNPAQPSGPSTTPPSADNQLNRRPLREKRLPLKLQDYVVNHL